MSRRLSRDTVALLTLAEATVYRAVDDAMSSHVLELQPGEVVAEDGLLAEQQDLIEGLRIELNAAYAAVDRLTNESENFAGEIDTAEKEIARLKAEFATSKSRGLALMEDVHAARKIKADAEARLSQATERANALEATAKQYGADIDRVSNQLSLANTRINGLLDDLKSAEQERVRLAAMLKAEEQRAARFESEAERLREGARTQTPAVRRDVVIDKDLTLSDTALEITNLLARGKNAQQIAAAYNVGKPQNECLNGPGVAAILEILGVR